LVEARGKVAEWCQRNYGGPAFCLQKDFPWDGEDIPAMVVFFAKHDGEVFPVC
jgi:hypothetical protein